MGREAGRVPLFCGVSQGYHRRAVPKMPTVHAGKALPPLPPSTPPCPLPPSSPAQAVAQVPDYDEGVMQSVLSTLATRELGEYEHRRRWVGRGRAGWGTG